MLFRAVFWIVIVWLLTPRLGETAVGPLASLSGSAHPVAVAAVNDLRGVLLDRLVAVRADIEAAERIRAGRGG